MNDIQFNLVGRAIKYSLLMLWSALRRSSDYLKSLSPIHFTKITLSKWILIYTYLLIGHQRKNYKIHQLLYGNKHRKHRKTLYINIQV